MYIRPKDSFISIISFIFHTLKLISLSALLTLTMLSVARAATVDVTTEFIADLSKPQNNSFVNTTPVSGFCNIPTVTCSSGEFSILIPGLDGVKYFDYTSKDFLRNHPSGSFDGTGKDVILTEVNTRQKIQGQFRFTNFGVKYVRMDENSGHLSNALVTMGPVVGNCTRRAAGGGGGGIAYWGLKIPKERVTCYQALSSGSLGLFQGDIRLEEISFGYTLDVPNPLGIYSGEYEGEVVYSVGDGGDIDFNAETTSDTEIRIKIKATVRHAFQLKFPSEGDIKVSLAPRGGWSQWVNGGRVPDSLSQEVPFTLSSTSGFTVNMRCEYDSGTGCALRETTSPTGEKIPLEVSLTLPGYKTENGTEARNLLLNSLPAGHVILPPGEFVIHRRSQIDFRVPKPGVEMMVKSPGSTWQGAVTLVFDTQVD
ncbi:hypothetical protein LH23_15535 [Cedecea neteri]|uniref:Fimbrial protein n=1 Tax=Cedecea neteri TaxID=158822 RepID=A0AAN0S6B1_9ENTR|nr:hypothetical protein [Cedecea neteri]AIR62014.1 hypothetical protein LH23_15535 [Cedecea neteri]